MPGIDSCEKPEGHGIPASASRRRSTTRANSLLEGRRSLSPLNTNFGQPFFRLAKIRKEELMYELLGSGKYFNLVGKLQVILLE
jgi:hypothetical protein